MVNNVVFDLGNVLLDFNSDKIIADHVQDDELHQQISANIFESEEWILLDRGTITAKEATKRFIRRMPENEKLIKEIMENWKQYLTPINENVEVLNNLAQKPINLYVLSNFHKEAFEEVYEKYDFFNHFDGLIISYREKTVKPEKEIYEKLITRFDLKPETTLFIDDSQRNIEAAQKMGFKTIHFNDNIKLSNSITDYITN
jgi:putative hydrolase of the HAD superfamily